MPELPEVETTKRSLKPLIGQTVQFVQVFQSQLRWDIPDLTCLVGCQLQSLQRRAKYIMADFGQYKMLWHLGMSGSFRICASDSERRKHDHVIIHFGQQCLHYHDPRRFGCLIWLNAASEEKLLAHLAPEPLSDEFNATYLQAKLKNKQTAIKTAIMDNHLVVGVGNIYATECLFKLGIHPAQPAYTLTLQHIIDLVAEIKSILTHAIQLGGSTLKDFSNAQGQQGYFQQTLLAYGRTGQPCVNCQTPLAQLKIGQRASVFCPHCQFLR